MHDLDWSFGCGEQPVADPGRRAGRDHLPDAIWATRRLVCTEDSGLITVAKRRGVPAAWGAGHAV
jgi:hypothetical protein